MFVNYIGDMNGNPLNVTVFDYAPKLVSAQFIGSVITIVFDKPVDVRSNGISLPFKGPLNCSFVFLSNISTDNQLWREGRDNDCILNKASASVFFMAFQGSFTQNLSTSPVVPGGYLTLAPSTIFTLGSNFSDAASGFVQIQAPKTLTSPVVVIQASSDVFVFYSRLVAALIILLTSVPLMVLQGVDGNLSLDHSLLLLPYRQIIILLFRL